MKPALRGVGRALALLVMLFTIGRGLVEFLTIHWGDPASYRTDWGGPSLLGVLLVHSGPGLVSAIVFIAIWRRRREHAAAG